jgi:hypothetical protein
MDTTAVTAATTASIFEERIWRGFGDRLSKRNAVEALDSHRETMYRMSSA